MLVFFIFFFFKRVICFMFLSLVDLWKFIVYWWFLLRNFCIYCKCLLLGSNLKVLLGVWIMFLAFFLE